MVKENEAKNGLKELAKTAVELGLGLVAVTEKKVREVAAELIKKGEIKKEEAEKFIDNLVKKTEKDRKDLEKKLSRFIQKGIDKIPLATKSEVEELKKKIEAIEKKL